MKRIAKILACVPGAYYYATRYARPNERVLHVLKYWVPYVLLMAMLGVDLKQHWAILVLTWLAFMAIYDVFCRENDEWSVRNESDPCLRSWAVDVSPGDFLWGRVAWFLCALAALGFLTDARVYPGLCLAFVTVAVVGAVHNRLPAPWRPLTYVLLYIAKGGIIMIAVLDAMDMPAVHRYGLYTLLFNLTYTPAYVARKVFGKSRESLLAAKIGTMRSLLLQPIVLKNIVLAALALWDIRFVTLLIWIDLLTLVEYVLGRRVQTI